MHADAERVAKRRLGAVVLVALRARNVEVAVPGRLELVVGDDLDAAAQRRKVGRARGGEKVVGAVLGERHDLEVNRKAAQHGRGRGEEDDHEAVHGGAPPPLLLLSRAPRASPATQNAGCGCLSDDGARRRTRRPPAAAPRPSEGERARAERAERITPARDDSWGRGA